MVRFSGPWTHRDVSANGTRLHIAEMLPSGGEAFAARPPLALLVHGFGGIWWTMRGLLEPLAAAGYHAVALDLRGHGDSDKPPRGYDAWTLAADVTNLIRALGHTEAVLVGHGEGGYLGWTAAYRRPRAVRALVAVSSPHPLAMRSQCLRSQAQRAAVLPDLTFDQIPRAAERRLLADDAAYIESVTRAHGGFAWTGSEDFAETARVLRLAMQIPKVAHLTLESRRWMFRSQFRPDGRDYRRTVRGQLEHQVLAIGGEQDSFVLPETIERSQRFAPATTQVMLPGVGHYAPMEDPAALAREIIEFAADLPQ